MWLNEHMKKFYIIPGWGETCRRMQYKALAAAVAKKGYEPVLIKVDWNRVLSEQVFPVEQDAVLFGFSLGGWLARRVGQTYPCALMICASITPQRHFKGGEPEQAAVDIVGTAMIADIKQTIKKKVKAQKTVVMYGDKEGEPADIIVPKTGHEISKKYVLEVVKLL
jgi:predicted esterase YcpF (UPF0227 family)